MDIFNEGLSKNDVSTKEKKELSRMKQEKGYYHTTLFQKVYSFLNGIYFTIFYTLKDTRKRWISFLIGLFSTVIVTFIVSVMYNTILKAPNIFLKVSEDQASEVDIQMMTLFTNSSSNPFLNTTDIRNKLQGNPYINGVTPRWMFLGSVSNAQNTTDSRNSSTIMMLMDTEMEDKLKIGRVWPYRILGKGECHVSIPVLRAIGVRAQRGERLKLKIDLASVFNALSGRTQQINQGVNAGGTTSQTSNNQTTSEILRQFLEESNYDFNQEYEVNITNLIENTDNYQDMPEWQKEMMRRMGVVTFTGEDLFNMMTAGMDANGGIEFELTVIEEMRWAYGRFEGAIGNPIIIDSKFFMEYIGNALVGQNAMTQFILQSTAEQEGTSSNIFSNIKFEEMAMQLVGMYNKRFQTYLLPEKEMKKEIVKLSDSIINSLGIDFPITVRYPLVDSLKSVKFISLFLDQIFLAITVLLGIMGVILIFTLLLSSVEEKTFEYGMIRALGLQKLTLIQVILLVSLYFAIPGIIFGIVGSFAINSGIEVLISKLIFTPLYWYNFLLNWISVILPIVLGVGIPVITNIIPIRRALSKRLRDSLDITHQQSNETNVRMQKLSKLGLNAWQFVGSILLVIVGFIIYYMIPYAFIFSELPLFFTILNSILLGMLFGMCLIALTLEPYLEKFIVFFMVWGPDRKMLSLIFKNMAGHRNRTRKTFLMFVLSVAFIVFSGVVFALQATNIVNNVQALVGANLKIMSTSSSYPLPEDKIEAFLNNEMNKPVKIVLGFTKTSFSIESFDFISQTRISNLAFYPNKKIKVYAIEKQFLDSTMNQYYLYKEYDRSFSYKRIGLKVDIFDSLYKDAGKAKVEGETEGFFPQRIFSGLELKKTINDSIAFDPTEKYKEYIDVVVSEALRNPVSVSVGKPMQLRTYCYYNHKDINKAYSASHQFISKARGMIYKIPGFFMTSYSLGANNSPVFVTFETYKLLAKRCADSVKFTKYENNVPIKDYFININKNVDYNTRVDMINKIRGLIDPDFSTIIDVVDIVSMTATTVNLMYIFFYIVSFIALVLCFFVLMISFTSNVKDNSWEFGVLRAVGLNVNQLIRVYIYEALGLVISAFLCGLVIGSALALTLTLQFNLFLEMPFQFEFPYLLIVIIFIMAVLFAIAGSWVPAQILKKKHIALVLRGLE